MIPQELRSKRRLELKEELNKAYKEEEIYWAQKARCKWLKERDKNTSYFHASIRVEGKKIKS